MAQSWQLKTCGFLVEILNMSMCSAA